MANDTAGSVFWQLLLAAQMSASRSAVWAERFRKNPADALTQLRQGVGLSASEINAIRKAPMAELERGLRSGLEVLAFESLPGGARDQGYPAIFAWGRSDALYQPMIAIVGTRRASPYGKSVAMKFAEHLTRAGLGIVSGGALGIDSAAARGSMLAGGKTVAVLGTGVDQVYPAANAQLFQEIRQAGCLVSQFPVGMTSLPATFVIRNHLIASLALGVLVIEAPHDSGALTTARDAIEMNKPVFVVPANIDQSNFWGSHNLIRDGATLVYHPDQLLEMIEWGFLGTESIKASHLSDLQKQILDVLTMEPIPAEKIAEDCGLDVSATLSELTMLELEGSVLRSHSGFSKVL